MSLWPSSREALTTWLGGRTAFILGIVLVAAGTAWFFAALGSEVLEGDTRYFDEWAVNALRSAEDPALPYGPDSLHGAIRDITALGGVTVLVLFSLLVTFYLVLRRQYHAAIFVAVVALGGLLLCVGLKGTFNRPRPEFYGSAYGAYGSSFPSGHSTMSAVVYLTLGGLLSRLVRARKLKFYFVGVALLLTGLVGFSRVYLAAHYPTDVFAGWTLGSAWALTAWMIARRLQRRGQIEGATANDDTADATPVGA